MAWTEAEITALVNDPGTLRDGKKLATTARWSNLGSSAQAVWGECKGSAKDPYRSCIDLSEPAFKCSCPSRKFPCKHGVALFLLYAQLQPNFPEAPVPEWVATWLDGRQKRAAAKVQQQDKPVDTAAQEKRVKAREAKVNAGMEELRLWLQDLVRRGLADDRVKSYEFWDRMAARMVDAQAGAIARRLRGLAGLPFQGRSDWPARMLDEVARIYLAADSYTRIETLPPDTQDDIRAFIGFTIKQDDLLAHPGLRDTWLVMTQNMETEDRLRVRRVWLHGLNTGGKALLLDFAHGRTPFEGSYASGQAFEAELVYYPGSYPQRAAIKRRLSATRYQPDDLSGYTFVTIEAALAEYSDALSCSPWVERFPVGLRAVIPFREDDRHYVRDADNHVIPMKIRASANPHPWLFAAVSGNRPVLLFGEWDGYEFTPLVVRADGVFFLC